MVLQTGLLRAQLAKLTGCNLETIRYYEKVGLLPPPPRSANGYRVYSPDLTQRLRFILRARDIGFSMEETRSLLALTDTGTQTCAEVKHKTEVQLEDVRAKIADLSQDQLIRNGGQPHPKCAGHRKSCTCKFRHRHIRWPALRR